MSRDDETWAELVEAFHSSPDAEPEGSPRWPDAENVDPDAEPLDDLDDIGDLDDIDWDASLDDPPKDRPDDDRPNAGGDGRPREARSASGDHFVPPPPPPIPRGDIVSQLAWAGVILPPVALIVMTVVGWTPPSWVVFLMVTGFVGGFGTLVARMRGHHPHDPDDGAVL